jgi:trans-AT polyketide synthase/acyltransferase/oxidoreductase domain-containing protein
MDHGVTSTALVARAGRAGMLSFFGSGGLAIDAVEQAVGDLQSQLSPDGLFGMSLPSGLGAPEQEAALVDLYLRHGVRFVEAINYLQITTPLVRMRLRGLKRDDGGLVSPVRIIARVSRPEVATLFLSPAPERIVAKLEQAGEISAEEARLAGEIPMADDLCVAADSGGPTDQGVAYALMPAMLKLRDELVAHHRYAQPVHVGAAGGIGTPQAAAAAFILGAEFIMTGSINQCTIEAATSTKVKEMLSEINVQDTTYAPAGDLFEMGARMQVLKRGLFFPARANKLHALYQQFGSLAEIDEKTRRQLQDKYFKRSFEEVWHILQNNARTEDLKKAENNPKYKMLMVFKWYFQHAGQLARSGSNDQKVDYLVHCGSAMGAFNQWAKGKPWEGDWRTRHVDQIAEHLMRETANLLNRRFKQLQRH